MVALIIEQSGEIKETFGYEIPFNKTIQQSILEYARANYGSNATVREMTNEEKANFLSRDRARLRPISKRPDAGVFSNW